MLDTISLVEQHADAGADEEGEEIGDDEGEDAVFVILVLIMLVILHMTAEALTIEAAHAGGCRVPPSQVPMFRREDVWAGAPVPGHVLQVEILVLFVDEYRRD